MYKANIEQENAQKDVKNANNGAASKILLKDEVIPKYYANLHEVSVPKADSEFLDVEKFNKIPLPLYVNGEPQYSDVTQGGVGDCPLVSYLAALAKYQPGKIKEMLKENKDDTVTVTLYPFGVKTQYNISKSLPDYLQRDIKCIWFRMIEKAVAFTVKDMKYKNVDNSKVNMEDCLNNVKTGGALADVPNLLFGKPSIYTEYGDYKKGNNKVLKRDYNKKQLELFACVLSNIKKNNIVTLSIDNNDKGFYSHHVYSVLGARIDEAGRLLIIIRNPHNRTGDKRYYSELPDKNFTLLQEPYLYDDAESGLTSETQAETEVDLNMLDNMKIKFSFSVLNADSISDFDSQEEFNNIMMSLKNKQGLVFYDKKDNQLQADAVSDFQNINRIEDTKEVNFDKSKLVKKSHLEEKNVVVPQGVTVITQGAFAKIIAQDDQPDYQVNDNIKSITLSSTVKYIDNNAFYRCINLESADLSKAGALKTINDGAFMFCENLYKVKFPYNLQEIGKSVFSGCRSLEFINLPSKLIKLGAMAFQKCRGLQEADLSALNSLKTIDDRTFELCENLSEVSFPENLQKIGVSAFSGCESIENIDFPAQLVEIENNAFKDCKSLQNVAFVSELRKIGDGAFENCESLETVDLSALNSLKTLGGAFSLCNSLSEVNLPDNLQEIGTNAFEYCEYLQDITLPDKLNKIGNGAFSQCRCIRYIKFPTQLSEIGEKAFESCSNLAAVDLSNLGSLKTIEDRTFLLCESLSEVNFPDNLQKIGEYAFSSCSELESLTFPKALNKISKYAFAGCGKLNYIDFSKLDSIPQIEDEAFDVDNIEKVRLKRSQEELVTKCGFDKKKTKFEYSIKS